MIFLRKLFIYFLLLVVIVGAGIFIAKRLQSGERTYNPFINPCRTPIKYSIGPIDPRFKITQEQLKDLIVQAVQVWNKASGLDLFEYDQSAPLQVKMVYDERQQETNEAESLQASLKFLEVKQAVLSKQYSGLNAQYDQKLKAFKSALSDYQKDLSDYNKSVSYWNNLGGAPEDEYDKLKEEQDDLNAEYKKLKSREKDLNSLSKQINTIAAQENKIVSSYNQSVTTFQNKYGGTQEFEKGVFDPSQGIVVYQFREDDDLRMTIIHELGHALGMKHVDNPKSIMYYLMGEQDLDNPTLTNEDAAELKNVCVLE